MEFADRGSLTQMVEEAARNPSRLGLFAERNLWRFLNQMSSALHYLHTLNILHRDIKPDNILGVSTGSGPRLKIADFGTAKLLDEEKVLSFRKKYTFGADIFSLGC